MIESFFPARHPEKVQNCWELKKVLAIEHFKIPGMRLMQPCLEHDRSRLDLMLLNGQLGVRGPSDSAGDFDFAPVVAPDSAMPEIIEMMKELLESEPSIEMAQLRFRYSEEAGKGVWFDCSNASIAEELSSGSFFRKLLEKEWTVEVGHKRQECVLNAKSVDLTEAKGRPWFSSFDENNNEIHLDSLISSFSQPGPEANRNLIAAAFELCDEHNLKDCTWVEWGAGVGNLSAAFSTLLTGKGLSFEADPTSASLLQTNSQNFFPQVTCAQGWARRWEENSDLLIIDPPRSGFPELLASLKDSKKKPRFVLAIHCHTRGLSSDITRLQEASYKLLDWSCVDIFPATPHMEHVSLWAAQP